VLAFFQAAFRLSIFLDPSFVWRGPRLLFFLRLIDPHQLFFGLLVGAGQMIAQI